MIELAAIGQQESQPLFRLFLQERLDRRHVLGDLVGIGLEHVLDRVLDGLLRDRFEALQAHIEVGEQHVVFQAVLVHDRREREGPHDRLGVVVQHPAPRLVGLLDLTLEMAENFAGLGCRPAGEQVFDLLQPLVVLDAEAANLTGVQLFERVDVERGSQDDLVKIAVLKAVLVHVPKLAVGLEGLVQVIQDQAADVAVGVDQSGPTLVAGLLDQEVPQA